MGVAFFIVLNKKRPGFDTFVNGKAIAQEAEAISKIAKRLKIEDIYDLVSHAAAAKELGIDPKAEGAKEKWFSADEGLEWVRALYEYIDTHPRSLKNRALTLEELDEYEIVLTNAKRIKAKWHFEMDI